jgi:replicative DNA helicase
VTLTPTSETLPPQNIEAEESALGAMLVAEAAVDMVTLDVRLRPDHFYRESHRKIFKAILSLEAKREGVDALTVAAELEKMGELEAIGGRAYLLQLASGVPAAGNVRHYAKLVKDQAKLRALLDAARRIEARVAQRRGEPDQLLEDSERLLFEIAHSERTADFRKIDDILHEEIDKLERLSREGQALTGTPSGFREMDDLTGGFQPSNLIVLAARPSMGKSALVTNIAENVAVKYKRPAALFSLEMSETELAQRFVASQARMSGDKLRKGQVARNDWPKVVKACQALEQAPLWVDDSSDIDILELRAKARRLHSTAGGLGLIVVDYLQLMRPDPSAEGRVVQIGQISRGLKILARELNVPVLAVSQLSRAPEQRPDKRPLLSDLRECVTGDTLVMLADGSRVPIASLVGQAPTVLSVDASGQVIEARSDKVWHVGKRDVFRVRLASGREIRATAEHRLRGAFGWTHIWELDAGDGIAVVEETSVSRGEFPSHSEDKSPRQRVSVGVRSRTDVRWDEIVSIEPAGPEDVYDLTVPGPACWLADSIVTHNSGQIEQDSDVVMFIYRDEYYNDETDNPGVAEIIVAKHRNGPVGKFELTFLERFPKFANKARERPPGTEQLPGEGPPMIGT